MALQDQLLCLGTPVREGHHMTQKAGQYDSPDPDNPDNQLVSASSAQHPNH